MNISTSKQVVKPAIPNSKPTPNDDAGEATASQTESMTPEERMADEDKRWQEWRAEADEYDKGSTTRGVLRTAVGVAAVATAGYYLGEFTGIGGAIAGAGLGLGAGITVGVAAGSYAGKDQGSSALGTVGIGGFIGAVAGTVAGGWAGLSAMPIAGAIAGGAGGVAVGYFAHAMMEDSAHDKMREKHGF